MAFAVLLLANIKQRCITAGAPFWIEGELPVFVVRPHAPNRDVRTVTVRYEYMYRSILILILIYIYIYITPNRKSWDSMENAKKKESSDF